jgi:hypothetical protein
VVTNTTCSSMKSSPTGGKPQLFAPDELLDRAHISGDE